MFSRLVSVSRVSNTLTRKFHVTAMAPINVGDKVPDVTLFEDSPGGKVGLAELCQGKKVVVFGVPGAFTPGCSKTHLPGYVEKAADIKSHGVDLIVCLAVNDPFVMAAWGQAHKADGKVRMLADPRGEFAKAAGLDLDLTAVLGNVRCTRFSMVVDKGKVCVLDVEPDGTGTTCS